MPDTKFKRLVFALLTVIITVHAYVFYSLWIVNGDAIMEINGAASVTEALNAQGGVYMLGGMRPIWAVIAIEFCFAYCLEIFVGSPLSFKLAGRAFPMDRTQPMLFEGAIICATVGIMCPAMSFIAALLYFPFYEGFSLAALLVLWVKLMCCNFPFAFFSQLFFIQPLVRRLFGLLFAAGRSKQIVPAMETDNGRPRGSGLIKGMEY